MVFACFSPLLSLCSFVWIFVLRNSSDRRLWYECLPHGLPTHSQHWWSDNELAHNRTGGLCMDPICGTGLARIFAQHHLQILRVDCHPAGFKNGGCWGKHVTLAAWVSSQVLRNMGFTANRVTDITDLLGPSPFSPQTCHCWQGEVSQWTSAAVLVSWVWRLPQGCCFSHLGCERETALLGPVWCLLDSAVWCFIHGWTVFLGSEESSGKRQ